MPVRTGEKPGRKQAATRALVGKYQLGRLVGKGGMGAVYEAEHLGLGARVAVKLLGDAAAGNDKAIARFRREARAMGALRHENVVAVMDADTDESGCPFLVMELLDGEDLNSIMRRERTLDAERAGWVASQVLAGLAIAHGKGIIHRDLKPGNIFIARQDDGTHRVKILDFGISKLADADLTRDVTAEGAMIGTPNCMAPEQILGQAELDPRIDVYAVGVLLYRLVTGRVPFASTSTTELYQKIVEGNPTPPRRHQPDVPAALEKVILKAMASDRRKRFADVMEFRRALHDALPSLDDSLARDVRLPLADIPGDLRAGDDTGTPPTVAGRPFARRSSGPDAARSMIGAPPRLHLAATLIAIVGLAFGGALWLSRRSQDAASSSSPEATNAPIVTSGVPLRFGLQRHMPREVVEERTAPLVEYLSRELERPVKLVLADEPMQLVDMLLGAEVDFAALTSASYVEAKERDRDLRLLAKAVSASGSPSYLGYILVRADSEISAIEQLAGRVFCYVTPGSTSGYVFPRALFRRHGMDPDTAFRATRFGGTHLETLRALYRGACDGAVVFAQTWHGAGAQGMPPESFRPIGRTDEIPYDGYCASSRLSRDVADRLQRALLALEPGGHAARAALVEARSPVAGLIPAADSDYDDVRKNMRLAESEPQSEPEPSAGSRAPARKE